MTRSNETAGNEPPEDQEALQRDANRYRWLRRFAVPAFNERSQRCVILLPRALGKGECLAVEGLDAVVDVFLQATSAGRSRPRQSS